MDRPCLSQPSCNAQHIAEKLQPLHAYILEISKLVQNVHADAILPPSYAGIIAGLSISSRR